MNNNKQESIGAIWKGSTRTGMEKLSISITIDGKKYSLIAFPNNFKTTENHPDYRIFESQQNASNQSLNQKTDNDTEVAKEAQTLAQEVSDDIPF